MGNYRDGMVENFLLSPVPYLHLNLLRDQSEKQTQMLAVFTIVPFPYTYSGVTRGGETSHVGIRAEAGNHARVTNWTNVSNSYDTLHRIVFLIGKLIRCTCR